MGNTRKWSLNTSETGKACGLNNGDTFKVYVAKILPLVSFAKPKEKTVAIRKTCFINADKCKPSISTKVKTRNYLNIPLSTNANIDCVKHGTKLKLTVQNKNIDKIYVEGIANTVQK